MKKLNKTSILLLLFALIVIIGTGCTTDSNNFNSANDYAISTYDIFADDDCTFSEQEKVVETTVTEAPRETKAETAQSTEKQGITYILNTNTKKFHYTYCSSVEQMSDNNKREYTGSREDIVSQGYSPCKRCNP